MVPAFRLVCCLIPVIRLLPGNTTQRNFLLAVHILIFIPECLHCFLGTHRKDVWWRATVVVRAVLVRTWDPILVRGGTGHWLLSVMDYHEKNADTSTERFSTKKVDQPIFTSGRYQHQVGEFGSASSLFFFFYGLAILDYYTAVFASARQFSSWTWIFLGFGVDLFTIMGILLFVGAMGKSAYPWSNL